MRAVETALAGTAAFSEARASLARGDSPVWISGIADPAKSAFIDALAGSSRYRLIITYSETRIRDLCAEMGFYDRNVMAWPTKDMIFFQADIHSSAIEAGRMACIRRLADGRPVTIVASAASLLTPCVPMSVIGD
ncbi:MAG: hypothetical protein II782_00890, partial [Oscillospiraceae bacterium]|nr:hypothetical protein [Oscillospiraceae bacterium]